jgi:hypothetical protein
MNGLNKVYIPYRVECKFTSNIEDEPSEQPNEPVYTRMNSPINPYNQTNQAHRRPKPKRNVIKYLPGERLLLKLGKQAKKERRNNLKVDINRINERMSRILKEF